MLLPSVRERLALDLVGMICDSFSRNTGGKGYVKRKRGQPRAEAGYTKPFLPYITGKNGERESRV